MSAATFAERLLQAMDNADMTVADLSYWFDRPYHTVWFWVDKKRKPRGTKRQIKLSSRRMDLLEQAIRTSRGLPVPIDMGQNDRPKYITKLRRDLENERAAS